jgi:hypothetical protein
MASHDNIASTPVTLIYTRYNLNQGYIPQQNHPKIVLWGPPSKILS